MPKITQNELKQNISQNSFSNLYFLTGEEYFLDSFKKSIADAVLKSNKNDFNFFNISSENLDVDQLEININTYPVGSNKKCIIINNLPLGQWEDAQFDSFINLIKDIPEFSTLIIAQTEKTTGIKNTNRIKKLQKTTAEFGIAVNFEAEKSDIKNELINYAKNHFNKILDKKAAEILIAKCSNYSLRELLSELKKICEFEKSEVLTENSLNNVFASKEKIKIFALPKLIISGETKKALDTLSELLEQGEEPISIVAIISGEYLDMFRVKTLLEARIPTGTLTSIFDYKSKEFRIKNAEKNCRNLSMQKIKKCLKLLTDADKKLKSSTLSPNFILSELIAKLTHIEYC